MEDGCRSDEEQLDDCRIAEYEAVFDQYSLDLGTQLLQTYESFLMETALVLYSNIFSFDLVGMDQCVEVPQHIEERERLARQCSCLFDDNNDRTWKDISCKAVKDSSFRPFMKIIGTQNTASLTNILLHQKEHRDTYHYYAGEPVNLITRLCKEYVPVVRCLSFRL